MIQTVMKALFPTSLAVNLTVEAVKKCMGNKPYSANVVAAVASFIVSVGIVLADCILAGEGFGASAVLSVFILAWASWLCATVGYDKVMQLLKQIGGEE